MKKYMYAGCKKPNKPNNIPRIAQAKLDHIHPLDACLPSDIDPMKVIAHITKRITGKNIPPVAVLFTHLKMLSISCMSLAFGVGNVAIIPLTP